MGVVGLNKFLGEEAQGQLPTILYWSDSIMFNSIITRCNVSYPGRMSQNVLVIWKLQNVTRNRKSDTKF